MAKPLVDEDLWPLIEPLFPAPKPRRARCPGRRPVDNRKVLTGILFVLKTGIPWEALPRELGCGSGITCWRRLRAWQQAGVWSRLYELLIANLHEAEKLDWSRAAETPAIVRTEVKRAKRAGTRGRRWARHSHHPEEGRAHLI